MKIKSLFAVAVLVTAIFCLSGIALAQTPTIDQLMAQIKALQVQLQAMQGQQGSATTQVWCHTFNDYLVAGSADATTNGEVSFLQTALTKSGFDVSGDNSGTFGDATAAAVVQYQGKNQITQTGTVGPKTRAQLNATYGCGPNQTTTQPTVVTPQVQTPVVTTTPANTTLCNGAYYSSCPTGTTFVCPASGAAYCQTQQNTLQNPLTQNPQQNQFNQPNLSCVKDSDCPQPTCPSQNNPQNSPQQNGTPPPPSCVGKKSTDTNLPQECQIWFGLLAQPATNSSACNVAPTKCVSNKCVFGTPTQPTAQPTQQPIQQQNVSPSIACASLYWVDNLNKTCQGPKQFCGPFMYPGLMVFNNQQDCTNATVSKSCSTSADCPTMCPVCLPAQGIPCPSNVSCLQETCTSGKCMPTQPTAQPTQQPIQQLNQQPNQTNQQPPASCIGHMPTDANLPADCAAWNAAHPPMSQPNQPYQPMTQDICAQGGGTWNSATNFCTPPNQPNSNQSSLDSRCGGPGQVWCPSPAGTGGWCQLPPCPASTTSTTGMNVLQSSAASISDALLKILQQLKTYLGQ